MFGNQNPACLSIFNFYSLFLSFLFASFSSQDSVVFDAYYSCMFNMHA